MNKILVIITLLFTVVALSLIRYLIQSSSFYTSPSKPISTLNINKISSASGTPKIQLNSNKLFKLVNDWRKENGQEFLIKSENMCSIAKKRMPEVQKKFSHENFVYYRFCENCWLGELIAKNFSTEKDVLDAWLATEKDSEKLKSDATHTCIEIKDSYVVQILGYF